eukprot:SAG11_NODE_1144_length_5695_cov_2.181558_1_plen_150_part_00
MKMHTAVVPVLNLNLYYLGSRILRPSRAPRDSADTRSSKKQQGGMSFNDAATAASAQSSSQSEVEHVTAPSSAAEVVDPAAESAPAAELAALPPAPTPAPAPPTAEPESGVKVHMHDQHRHSDDIEICAVSCALDYAHFRCDRQALGVV